MTPHLQPPRTPQEFLTGARQIVRTSTDRDLLAYAERFAAQFAGQFTREELSEMEGWFEAAQMAVDLEEWAPGQAQVSQASTTGAPETATQTQPAASRSPVVAP